MSIKERNGEILQFLISNPIKLGTENCYKEVCEKFQVNSDVIRGILRRNPSVKEMQIQSPSHSQIDYQISKETLKSELSENLVSGEKSITKKINYEIKGVDELISELQIDTDKYDVVKWKCSTWQMPKKDSESPTQLYAVNCELKPKRLDSEIDILESFKEIVSKLKKTPYIPVIDSSDKSLFIYLSDTHVGAYVPSDSLYTNEYSATVFSKRLDKVLDTVTTLTNIHGVFENIFVVNLGDCIDGFNNTTARGGHFLPQNLSNKQQFETYFQTMKEFLENIIEEGFSQNVKFISVGDSNHAGSLEYVLNRAIEIYLNAVYPSVETKVFDKFIEHIQLGENTFIFLHGKDSEAMKHGFPRDLNDKVENFFNDYIYQHNIKTKNIYVVKGDLHQSAHQWGKRFMYKNVMSFFGSSKWIHTNFGSGRAGVEFQIVDKEGTFSTDDRLFF